MEIALDQFNPLRMSASSASSNARQPGLLHSLRPVDKAKAIRDAALFPHGAFEIRGMGETILKNILHRLVFRQYRIPAAE